MKRSILVELENWKNSSLRKPLLLRGARQIGKTHSIREFGKNHFEHLLEINFELEPKYKSYFNDLDPNSIIKQLKLIHKTPIIPGKTLLFFDEIQDCLQAIMALRYFKELMPELHVIAAGSLLEFSLNKDNFRMPVGRVEYRFMYPMSFEEFLWANEHASLHDFLTQCELSKGIPEAIHHELITLFREYLILGGMPEVISAYQTTKDYASCQAIQTHLLNTYRNDFGKYTKLKHLPMIEELFRKAPEQVGQIFKYSHINPDYRSREIKESLRHLILANLLTPIYDTAATGLPLHTTKNEKKFKINFVDTGLVTNISNLSASLLMQKDFFTLNRGTIIEQAVGQELLAYSNPLLPGELYFWTKADKKHSKAEIDYVIQHQDKIIPIEVKAGTTGRLKSLHSFLEATKNKLGVRISLHPLSFEKNILSIPAYMVHQLPRLLDSVFY